MNSQEKFQLLNQKDSLLVASKNEHIVFYDKDIEQIEELLSGSLANISYIPVNKSDDS